MSQPWQTTSDTTAAPKTKGGWDSAEQFNHIKMSPLHFFLHFFNRPNAKWFHACQPQCKAINQRFRSQGSFHWSRSHIEPLFDGEKLRKLIQQNSDVMLIKKIDCLVFSGTQTQNLQLKSVFCRMQGCSDNLAVVSGQCGDLTVPWSRVRIHLGLRV